MPKSTTVEYKCEQCGQVIGTRVNDGEMRLGYLWYDTKSIAMPVRNTLEFYAWNDHLADHDRALLFHGIGCAERYLGQWLRDQEPKVVAEESDIVVYPPPVVPQQVFIELKTMQERMEAVSGGVWDSPAPAPVEDLPVVDAEYPEVDEDTPI